MDLRKGVGYVLTARHVVNDDEAITVEVFEKDVSLGGYDGILLLKSGRSGTDSDVALLMFKSLREFKAVSLATKDYSVAVGDRVIQIGCPHGTIPPKTLAEIVNIVAIVIKAQAP